ncbi:MAG: hypothetical protein GQ532_11935 [Methylomarinum sp.]|nr:hypothetical protein [Methylomarinum sp.]
MIDFGNWVVRLYLVVQNNRHILYCSNLFIIHSSGPDFLISKEKGTSLNAISYGYPTKYTRSIHDHLSMINQIIGIKMDVLKIKPYLIVGGHSNIEINKRYSYVYQKMMFSSWSKRRLTLIPFIILLLIISGCTQSKESGAPNELAVNSTSDKLEKTVLVSHEYEIIDDKAQRLKVFRRAPDRIEKNESNSRCLLKPETGHCRAAISKFYFDNSSNTCEVFIWGGCRGVVPFDTRSECISACITGNNSEHINKLENSLSSWHVLKRQKGASYQYATEFSSWVGFGNETIISVKRDVVVEREYRSWNNKGEKTLFWNELSPNELGKHKEGAPLKTMDELYDDCREILITKGSEKNRINLSFNKRGIMRTCLYTPKYCADDCSSGVRIKSLSFQKLKYQACTNDWLLQVEKDVLTGDGQGHGPDIGSLEWRSVIEFKLGIRNDPKVPPKESPQWCNYINENFINSGI